MAENLPTDRIGKVLLYPGGTGVGTFDFVVAADAAVDVVVNTPVVAVTEDGDVVGLVVDMRIVGAGGDPLRAANDGQLGSQMAPLTRSPRDVMVATAQVYHSPAGMRPVRPGPVRAATATDIARATGAATIDWPIPAGVMSLAHGWAPIAVDGHTLMGNESAHLMVGGRSGAASKTSYVSVLLRSTLAASRPGDTAAALIFNVKGSDLCFLDKAPEPGYELDDTDVAIYAAMGVPAAPFEDVTVYAPATPGGQSTYSERDDAVPVRWGIRETWTALRQFNRSLYDNENQVALIEDLGSYKIFCDRPLTSLGQVVNFLATELEEAGDSDRIWRNHHPASARRLLKLIDGLPERTKGLVARDTVTGQDVPAGGYGAGEVRVVDISGLEPGVQGAVIARTLNQLHKAVENNRVGVDHLAVFVDELNIFAPSSGGEIPGVKAELARIAATGRYAGVSLWGAAQFLSQVNNQVRDNSATTAFGVLAEAEVDSGVYGRLPAGLREQAVTLSKGQMMLRAYTLRGLTTVRFPRPAWRTGKSRQAPTRGTALDAVDLSAAAMRKLSEGVDADQVAAIAARVDGDPGQFAAQLDAVRIPDMGAVSVERPSTYDPTDPWGLD